MVFSVFIIENNYPEDFYKGRLDGYVAQQVLHLIGVTNKLRLVLDLAHFEEALKEASRKTFHIIHLSCHDDNDGIALANDTQLTWHEFAACFQNLEYCPGALIMSACCGADKGIEKAFQQLEKRPQIIFGSTDKRDFNEYATAWTILYHRLSRNGETKKSAQQALKEIRAVVAGQFIYRRWDDKKRRYVQFSGNKTSKK